MASYERRIADLLAENRTTKELARPIVTAEVVSKLVLYAA
jgi:hypothetical protein